MTNAMPRSEFQLVIIFLSTNGCSRFFRSSKGFSSLNESFLQNFHPRYTKKQKQHTLLATKPFPTLLLSKHTLRLLREQYLRHGQNNINHLFQMSLQDKK